ncbi:hypothetical protein [Lactovum odontotermitis]
MKFKLIPTERRLARQFKPQKVEIAEAEEEIRRLIHFSKKKNRERPILATLQFDDGSGKAALVSQPISFDEDTAVNISYWAIQMMGTRYASADQALKDQFLNQLYEELAENVEEQGDETEPPFSLVEKPVQKKCPVCGKSFEGALVDCPRCGQNQNERDVSENTQTEEKRLLCASCGEEIEEYLLSCPYCGKSQKEKKFSGQPIEKPEGDNSQLSKEETAFDVPQAFLSTLQSLIEKQEASNIQRQQAEITEKWQVRKEQAQKEKKAVLDSAKVEALEQLKKEFEHREQELKKDYEAKYQEIRKELETAMAQEAGEEIREAGEKQKESAKMLLAQLMQFLNVEGHFKS